MKKIKEGMDFRQFINSAYAGGSGYQYGFGVNPEEYEPSIEEILSYIDAISKAATAKYESLEDKHKEHVYIKRQLEKSKRHLTEAYLRLMDLDRTIR